ncbi:hypothetical protein [Enterovirga aerilata]|uniref:Uncharacterized protein n=1 Tax=Enterovirga aerilata TaxID=2730920 RepID=A0A849IGF6_9HYPH|nr:hypothetical protein [Enterovirga sp. DB1703]NNM75037.1 hypothetical protein [Enterovirga sp. DB1703]
MRHYLESDLRLDLRIDELFRGSAHCKPLDTDEIAIRLNLTQAEVANRLARHRDRLAAEKGHPRPTPHYRPRDDERAEVNTP